MDPSTIVPFIKSTKNLFETMLQMPVEMGEPSIKPASAPSFDVSGIIGFAGDYEGSVVLSFPAATAVRVASVFTGADVATGSDDLTDAVGELVNMIAGGAKAQFSGRKISISCPSVVVGENHVVHGRKDFACVQIPCVCDCGEFAIELAIRPARAPAPAAAAPAVANA
ncbi:MAG: chemotaxis protein CheX [Phycisphaerales bacterium]|nr:chemotaxis protein CheX [Phycisphaerales bacterium]